MAIPSVLKQALRLPIIGSPMFISSGIELVVEQCINGIVGSFPAINARPQAQLVDWIAEIRERLTAAQLANPERKVAPFAINQVMSPLNTRWEADLTTIIQQKAPIIITSLRAPPPEIIQEVHSYGGLVFHDVTSVRHARKAASMGVDGLILVCAGAGGQGGDRSPFALINEVRQFFDGVILLAGALSTGRDVLAAQAMGADLAYMGTRFLASRESGASDSHKEEIIESVASDIIYTNSFTGIYGNYLRPSLIKANLDPDNLPPYSEETRKYRSTDNGDIKIWKDIRGCGHGCGSIHGSERVADIIAKLEVEYHEASAEMKSKIFTQARANTTKLHLA
ncbi:NAD(P)H-dependent flavin oxidoreductase [Glaciimonas soli]|uniref:Nitronate monooxygenase n=1 Tax=Glaciimonas soli TaxID=2590999 RepID=A0A843YS35_9BURK|nr:nitronate monooxygenase family protein [Glaciimonas soli]MQR02375.1 nitronate monooxygenase [Glaciimonas soli]